MYFRANDMKIFKFIFGLIAICSINIQAAFVNPNSAKSVAQQFLSSQHGVTVDQELIFLHKEIQVNNQTLIYVFNLSAENNLDFF